MSNLENRFSRVVEQFEAWHYNIMFITHTLMYFCKDYHALFTQVIDIWIDDNYMNNW